MVEGKNRTPWTWPRRWNTTRARGLHGRQRTRRWNPMGMAWNHAKEQRWNRKRMQAIPRWNKRTEHATERVKQNEDCTWNEKDPFPWQASHTYPLPKHIGISKRSPNRKMGNGETLAVHSTLQLDCRQEQADPAKNSTGSMCSRAGNIRSLLSDCRKFDVSGEGLSSTSFP